MRNVADTGLQILLKLLQNVEQHESVAPSFYQTYLTDILQHVFSVVTDTSHTAALSMHATILAYIFSLVEAGRVNCQLGPTTDNVLFIQDFTATLLRSAFPHLTDNQIKIMVQGMFNLDQDIPAFKEHLRDFLVQIREYTGEDDTDLFLEEREKALQAAQTEKRRIQLSVPGILNPARSS
ncbi:hypothetical protein NQ317_007053 [Molorchus minor]|uniref:Exportin-1 C-terminal domain-containing protein n=1 Tax=Molorchus minor TaxID=1323400 RepID=A0ABQ9K6N6_9CUCU|nr:hypothetical protein NQ317_007053 [Molorchus minor]